MYSICLPSSPTENVPEMASQEKKEQKTHTNSYKTSLLIYTTRQDENRIKTAAKVMA